MPHKDPEQRKKTGREWARKNKDLINQRRRLRHLKEPWKELRSAAKARAKRKTFRLISQ